MRAASQKLFGALEAAQPEGVRYAWILLPDGETFAALVQVDDGVENPIPNFPEFRELQEVTNDALAEQASVRPSDRDRLLPACSERVGTSPAAVVGSPVRPAGTIAQMPRLATRGAGAGLGLGLGLGLGRLRISAPWRR